MTTLTRTLADFVVDTRFDDLPAPVVAECKRLLLDTLGCALGAIDTESGQIALRYAAQLGGNSSASVLGGTRRTSATVAAYTNARLANVLDADDTFPTSTHFGNATVFSSLALAESLASSGRELLAAIAVGFDVGARIGSWMGAPMQIENGKVIGWNELGGPAATITWAAIGASAHIADLDADQAQHAFGIGGSNCPLPTLRKWASSIIQPMYKYADAGWCAEIGVSSALLAKLGSTGFLNILDGDDAFWKFYGSPGHDDKALLNGLGSDWHILNTTYKPWPCCRWIHHPLTAFTRLRQRHNLHPDEIERVVVRANPFALTPIFLEQQPKDALSAEFSHAHALAAAAFDIPAGPRWYARETMDDPAIANFRSRVTVVPEPRSANIAEWMTGGQWRGVPGGVDVHVRGEILSETADYSLGDPWDNSTVFSDDAIRGKFETMIGLDADRKGDSPLRETSAELSDVIHDLEKYPVSKLGDCLNDVVQAMRRVECR
ncbi:MmgE/PrpD family protein [Burkholderia multivorans]|uniref:MmgE/PrpD family protein n=1 Tax=Burkholderia multivorans TaxID=87883 RepID=UPI0019B56F60|nr:MmgE/PrpD family protein [Burkholderia multivorans]MBU9669182.1 MmgE/PrpD family protein [Burkholderia multivorans]CAB5300853.1 MmgE/PrpD family protein [Burkholderia multivorans]CAB5305652.1 MmgE/PrpD family protein [Burkholderia multivorans]CAB5310366.1 MmgE/PrpD family protein [Burkholderia multivorans]CAB5312386.1 MmgE/PrpD family protein [Burkholderia multivorans]